MITFGSGSRVFRSQVMTSPKRKRCIFESQRSGNLALRGAASGELTVTRVVGVGTALLSCARRIPRSTSARAFLGALGMTEDSGCMRGLVPIANSSRVLTSRWKTEVMHISVFIVMVIVTVCGLSHGDIMTSSAAYYKMPGASFSFPSFLTSVSCSVLSSSSVSLATLLPNREHLCHLCFIAPPTENLSSQCISALTNIAANAAASQCLAISALIPVVTASQNTSLVQPFNNWLGSMCGAPACSNATIAAVVTNLTSGCSTELKVSSDPAPLIPTVQSLYPTVRKILCLKQYVQNSFDPTSC